MDKHMDQWLGAYLDGELRGVRRRQVADHLDDCPQCRAELKALTQLSSLLQADPLPENVFPAARFADEVALQLPRLQPGKSIKRGNWSTVGLWLVPVGAIGVWVFMVVVSTLVNAAGVALQTGLISNLPAWVALPADYGALSGVMLNTLNGSLDTTLRAGLEAVGRQELFWRGVAGHLLLQAILVLVYWSWLAGWLLPRRRLERVDN